MAVDFDLTNFNTTITDGKTNSGLPNEIEIEKGIIYNSDSDAVIVNKFLYKISSAIKYIQESGGILWQKDKQYPLGSVVTIVEKVANSYTLKKLKCIEVDATGFTNQIPVNGTLNTDSKNLTTYFTNITSINTKYWEEVKEYDSNTITYNTKDDGKKYIQLIDPTNKTSIKTKLGIQLKRYNTNKSGYDEIFFTLYYTFYKDTAYVEIYDMKCNNFVRKSSSVEDKYSIFGSLHYAILGFGIVLTQDNKLYIQVDYDSNAFIDTSKDILLKIRSFRDSNALELKTTTSSITGSYIPIRNGSNSKRTDTKYVVESTVPFTLEDMFRRGLLTTLMPSPYSSFELPDKNLYNLNTLDTLKYTNEDLKWFRIPLIKGRCQPSKDVKWAPSAGVNAEEITVGHNYFVVSTGMTFPNSNRAFFYSIHTEPVDNLREATGLVTHGPVAQNIFTMKQPELSYPKKPSFYPEDICNLFPRSIRVYRYVKY